MTGPCTLRNADGASINDSGILNPIPAIFCTFTLTLVFVFTPTPVSALCLLEKYINEDLQRAIKLSLELFVKSQEYGQLQANIALRKHLLKAQNIGFYYKSLHIKCYYFC